MAKTHPVPEAHRTLLVLLCNLQACGRLSSKRMDVALESGTQVLPLDKAAGVNCSASEGSSHICSLNQSQMSKEPSVSLECPTTDFDLSNLANLQCSLMCLSCYKVPLWGTLESRAVSWSMPSGVVCLALQKLHTHSTQALLTCSNCFCIYSH